MDDADIGRRLSGGQLHIFQGEMAGPSPLAGGSPPLRIADDQITLQGTNGIWMASLKSGQTPSMILSM